MFDGLREDWEPGPAWLWFAIGVALMLTAGAVGAAMLAWAPLS